jgi:hypothetical protein
MMGHLMTQAGAHLSVGVVDQIPVRAPVAAAKALCPRSQCHDCRRAEEISAPSFR